MKQWEPSLFFRVCRLLLRVQILLGLIIFCYNYFFQSYLGVGILLYVGWMIGLAGLVFFLLGLYEFKKKGEAAEGKNFLLTTVLVDSGIYSVVRHPEYLGSMLLVLGSILISQHWLTLVLGVPLLIWFFAYVFPEADRDLVEKFGDNYKRYMQNVPSTNLLVGVIRLLKRRERG
jgi:protein-S-isoprenylcysteine O-methyltransferase Ste14